MSTSAQCVCKLFHCAVRGALHRGDSRDQRVRRAEAQAFSYDRLAEATARQRRAPKLTRPVARRISDDGSGTGSKPVESPRFTKLIVPENVLLSIPLLSMKFMLNGSIVEMEHPFLETTCGCLQAYTFNPAKNASC